MFRELGLFTGYRSAPINIKVIFVIIIIKHLFFNSGNDDIIIFKVNEHFVTFQIVN